MCGIVQVEPVAIAKDGCRFLERHAMFLKIGDRLRNIPRKHSCVYTVMNLLTQSTSHRNLHELQPIYSFSFVVRHAMTAALRSRTEARMNGAPGSWRDVMDEESVRMK